MQTSTGAGLRVLGRQHEAADAAAAFGRRGDAGFTNISLDLIFGWPGQTLETWRPTWKRCSAGRRGPDHLSLYSLIVEPGTPMADAVASRRI